MVGLVRDAHGAAVAVFVGMMKKRVCWLSNLSLHMWFAVLFDPVGV